MYVPWTNSTHILVRGDGHVVLIKGEGQRLWVYITCIRQAFQISTMPSYGFLFHQGNTLHMHIMFNDNFRNSLRMRYISCQLHASINSSSNVFKLSICKGLL